MSIPTSSNYPEAFDTDDNLFVAHDALRVQLASDYNPGDKSITISGDAETVSRFPPTGLITLTEQRSHAEERAISFYYASRTSTTFDGLELLPRFPDVVKSKSITNVTQNTMDSHHNAVKDALIAVQKFAGKKGEVAPRPLEGTMEARTNYLRNVVLTPKAWFSAAKTIGLVPLVVPFKDLSFRLGTDGTSGSITHIWDFGDESGPSVVTISQTTIVPSCPSTVSESVSIEHTYARPGIFDVTLTVTNAFGTDTVVLPGLINARIPAPDPAVIDLVPRSGQTLTPGTPSGGPYAVNPKIRATANTLIDLEVPLGFNPNTGLSYAGEELDGHGRAIDPITSYTWSLADDLQHNNSSTARVSYSVGGVYDLILRVDTEYGAYRITSYPDALDVVERDNLWLWTFDNSESASSYEFGLLSETFKAKAPTPLVVGYDTSFLAGQSNAAQQIKEFKKNNGFAQRGSSQSGLGGSGLLYWASGRGQADSPSLEKIQFSEFNGFTETYVARPSIFRPWNWVPLASPDKVYFILGGDGTDPAANTSPTNQTKHDLTLSDLSVASTTLSNSNYKNGADELKQNEVTYSGGETEQGDMSVYRSCWRADTGFVLRNQGVGSFFRLSSFYRTSGNATESFIDIRKLPNMAGPAKVEGQLVPLSQGVFFFNNSGSVAAYNPTSGVWETGGPGINSAAFRSFQDTSMIGFDDPGNTLLAASDGQHIAYLSYDYSAKAFVKFNSADLTFSKVVARPGGVQWQIQIF